MTNPPADDVLVIFAKYPTPGKVKTRLARSIGAARAARLYRGFLKIILKKFAASPPADRIVCAISPVSRVEQFAGEFPGANAYIAQADVADLGERMHIVFEQILTQGARKVVIIGSDSPNLPLQFVRQAFEALDAADVVLGPAEDGGYYLIGVRESHAEIFRDIEWGTNRVLRQSISRIHNSGLRLSLLEPFYDVDDLHGLMRLIDDAPGIFAELGVSGAEVALLRPSA